LLANAIALAGVVLFPTLLGCAVLGTLRLWQWLQTRDRRPIPMDLPIERIAADARRLRTQREELLGQAPAPGRRLRTEALDAAYLDTLAAACRALDVPPPPGGASGAGATSEICRVETELGRRGLDVRTHGVC
jgi:hypothetical protein